MFLAAEPYRQIKSVLCSALVVILAPLVLPALYAQSFSLVGLVRSSADGQPIANALVTVRELNRTVRTDSTGCFTVEAIAPGTYTILLHHVAFADAERRATTVQSLQDSITFDLHPAILLADEVIVCSSRSLSSLEDHPLPLAIVDRRELARHSPPTIADALRTIPGIALVRDGSWQTAISLRGLGSSNVVTLIDDARLETSTDIAGALSLININDLERVETIRSPGSALHGTGALGGVVQCITRRPAFSERSKWNAELSESASSVDERLAHYVALSGSSADYAMRISGGYRRAKNTRTPSGEIPNSQFTDMTGSAAFIAKVVGDQTLQLSYQRAQAEHAGIPGGAPIALTAGAQYLLARRELFSIQYQMPNPSPTIPLVRFRMSRQAIQRNVEIIQSPSVTVTPRAVHTTSSAHAEAMILPHRDHVLTIGADVWERHLDSHRERINRSTSQIIGERPVPSSTFLSAGMFVQDEWTMIPKDIVFIAGSRYDWIRVRNDATWNPEYIVTAGLAQIPPANQQLLWPQAELRNRSWSANAGLRCRISTSVNVTFALASAFRSPSLEERYQFIDLGNLVRIGDPTLQPERSFSLNLGARYRSDAASIHIDAFLNMLSDLVADMPGVYNGRAACFKRNIGEARIHGFEVSVEYALADHASLRGSASYVRGEDTRTHVNLPQIVPMNALMELSMQQPSWGSASVTLASAATQDLVASGERQTAGFAVVDADVASDPWGFGPYLLTLRASIQNIFNRSYHNHLSTLRGNITDEPGRNFSVELQIAR